MKKILIMIFIFISFISFSTFKEDGIYFVQITDAHVKDTESLANLGKAIRVINRIPFEVKCVVVTGDLVESRYGEEYYEKSFAALKELKTPYYYLPGNHELNTSDYKDNLDLLNQYYEIKDVYSINIDKYIFIMTNNIFTSYGNADNIKTVESILKKNPFKPAIIFGHIPSSNMFENGVIYKGWYKENKGLWGKIINNNNVIAEIGGHHHSDELHYIGKVPVYVSSSLSTKYGRQPTFRIYNINKKKVSYRTVYI